MQDKTILELLKARDEKALRMLTDSCGKQCRRLAARLLHSEQDAEEVWSDALLQLWNAVPPAEPRDLRAYLYTIVRNLCKKRLEHDTAQKRGGGVSALSLEALPESAQPKRNAVEETVGEILLNEAVNRFLRTLSPDACTIFIQRYGNGRSIAEIAALYEITGNKVALSLMRTRVKLKKFLKEEGWL